MAANSKGGAIAGGIGKRFAIRIWTAGCSRDPAPLPSSFAASPSRRALHSSTYDKEVDDQACPTVVPDHVIQPGSDDYWEPHPKTGVFGPAVQDDGVGDWENCPRGSPSPSSSSGNGSSVLDEAAWFRPTEDVDKPPYA